MGDRKPDSGTDPTAIEDGAPPLHRRVLLVVGHGLSATFPLPDAGTVTLGRSRSCDACVDHPSISRRHASFHLGEFIEVEDLASANGTRIGERRLPAGQRVLVRPGEVVDVGAILCIVQERAAPVRRRRIWNHGLFEERVDDECARAARAGTPFTLLRVRAPEGASEAVVEQCVSEAVRRVDVVGRYGPLDWEVMLIDADGAEAEAIAARIAAQAPQVSVGMAVYPRDGRDPMALADAAVGRMRGAPAPAAERAPAATGASMPALERLVERVAEGSISVLILGETGVGKEVLAARIHELSPRRGKPFVRINCAALSATLLESELFGHVKGAFTGADRAKPGLLETADGGTVLLDEVGELPEATQVKLLRVIEQREILPVGAVGPRSIDVRFLAATNRELEVEIQRRAFRSDLYFRLAGITLRIPPLRERVGEIAGLAATFLKEVAGNLPGKAGLTLSPAALRLLERYHWPGNIRELRHTIERAALLCTGATIEPEHLPLDRMMDGEVAPPVEPPSAPAPAPPATLPAPAPTPGAPTPATVADLNVEIDRLERERILRALDECGGNQTRAAEMLGISRSKLISRLDSYGVPRPRRR